MVPDFMGNHFYDIPATNLTITNNRVGVTRSAMFLFVFIVIHVVGNLHAFLGPDDFNGRQSFAESFV